MIEALENRIAPAALHGNVLTYTDFDGDLVKVTFTHATMAASDFGFNDGPGLNNDITDPQFLSSISMTGHVGGGFTLTARQQHGKGDGRANIGTITSTDTPLGAIVIDGDLSIADFSSGSKTVASIRSLTVQSLGGDVTTPQALVDFQGITALTVKADISNVEVVLNTSTIVTRSISIGGDLRGGNFTNSADLLTQEPVTAVKIGGSIIGGAANEAGLLVISSTGLHSLTIGGSILGGVQTFTGELEVGAEEPAAVIRIGGNVVAGTAGGTGFITLQDAKSLTIAGAVVGTGTVSAGMVTGSNLGTLTLGSIIGGSTSDNLNLASSGYVDLDGNVGTIKVTGGLYAGQNPGTGTIETDGMLSVKGTVGTATIGTLEGSATRPAIFSVGGGLGNSGAAIKTLTITHSVVFGSILAGYEDNTKDIVSANAGIGSISIHGNFTASYITAGATAGADGMAGNSDDVLINTATATIGSIRIGGQINGVAGSDVAYRISASLIDRLQVGTAVYGHGALVAVPTFDEIGNAFAQSLH